MNAPGADFEPILECRSLSKHFRILSRTICVFEDVLFSVKRGEIAVITGKTGSGKTTLLSLLGGLDRPTSGTILLEGRRVDQLTNPEWSTIRRGKIGFLFQNFNLLPAWTALENVEAAMLHTDIPKSTRREKAQALLATCGLEEYFSHLPCELSLGQQQLVALARALANDPPILLADEPTGEVDPETAKELVGRLTDSVRTKEMTLIVTTHGTFPRDAADCAFRLSNRNLTSIELGHGNS